MQKTLKYKWVLVAFVVGVASFSFVSWTLARTAGSEITVCVEEKGTMYMVGEGFKSANCKDNDQLISWNVTGPQGPTGADGQPGIQGGPGAQGPQGLQGERGTQGLVGPTGETGSQGSIGSSGSNGTNGTNGTNGLTGATGPVGQIGATGSQGLQGLAGVAGPQGLAGGIDKSRIYRRIFATSTESSVVHQITAYCYDANDVLLSGGYWAGGTTLQIVANVDVEDVGISGWRVRAYSPVAGLWFNVSATCLRVD